MPDTLKPPIGWPGALTFVSLLTPILYLAGPATERIAVRRRLRWLAVACALAASIAAAAVWQPFETHFRGIGMTSSRTVAIFGWLDAAAAGRYGPGAADL